MYNRRHVVVVYQPYSWYHPYYTYGDDAFPMYAVYVILGIILFICILISVLSICCPNPQPSPYVEPVYDPYGPDIYVAEPVVVVHERHAYPPTHCGRAPKHYNPHPQKKTAPEPAPTTSSAKTSSVSPSASKSSIPKSSSKHSSQEKSSKENVEK